MNNERGRIRRFRLIAGILAGLFAGTAHALVTHAMSRRTAAPAVVRPGLAAMGDLMVVDADGQLLLVVVDQAGGGDGGTR